MDESEICRAWSVVNLSWRPSKMKETQQKPEANAGAHLELGDPDPLVAPVVSLVTNHVRHV